jgi:ribonuclease D
VTRLTDIIDTDAALAEAVRQWQTEPALGIDTEANSFFVYRERTCLVQVSSRTADWIIDPFVVNLAALGPVLANPAVEKVLHASEFDIVSLKRDYAIGFTNVFDTMIAAKAVGHRKVGLANLAEELLGVKLAKDEQRSDWGRRPLTREQVEYAFADTRHLLPLADALKEKVRAAGPLIGEEVDIDCQRITEREARPREVDVDAFERHKLARKLDPVARQVMKALYAAREARARETDKPPFRVVSDDALLEISQRQPKDRAELLKISGVTPGLAGRHGDALLQAVKDGLALGPLPFQRRAPAVVDLEEEARFESLRAWRKVTADARGVEVEVIANNSVLKVLAKANPATIEAVGESGALDPVRLRRYGAALLEVLRRPRSPG